MGGGDLNLKKSWHPHTIKNQEKVWKAEKAKTQEENKLNDLRKEIEEEKNREELTSVGKKSGVLGVTSESEKKLDWMYKGPTDLINREEYLLGRKIDKSFEILQAEEQQKDQQNLFGVKQSLNHVEHECVPFSIRSYKSVQNTEQVDLQRKVLEDPLMLIKQREMESRRKILENPVKLKELHRMLKTDEKLQKVSKKLKKSKKSKKSKKKKKKKTKYSTSSNDSDTDTNSDLDSILEKKLRDGILDKDDVSSMGLNLTKLLDSKFEKISHELQKAAKKSQKHIQNNKELKSDASDTRNISVEHYKRQSRSSSNNSFCHENRKFRSMSRDRNMRYNKYIDKRPKSPAKRNHSGRRNKRSSRSMSQSKDINKKRRKSRSFSRSRERKTEKSRDHSGARSNDRKLKNRYSCSSPSNKYNTKACTRTRDNVFSERSKPNSQTETHKSQKFDNRSLTKNIEPITSGTKTLGKLTEEEKQIKLKEMMTNAAWREEERTEVVRRHRESCAQEEKCHTDQEFDKNFLNKEIKKAIANQTSIGSRLRANLNNIQRTSAAMNANFAKK